MILPDWRIRQLSLTLNMIYPVHNRRFAPVGYDLTVSTVEDVNPEDFIDVELLHGESILVHCVEDVMMPSDVVAFVVARNSAIRDGLQIVSPVYQPGHKTNVKFRVVNTGPRGVVINKATPLAMMMFDMLVDRPNSLYEGRFQNEK